MGREVGGGIGMGKTGEPKAFSFQCMTKFTTNKKKKEDRIYCPQKDLMKLYHFAFKAFDKDRILFLKILHSYFKEGRT